MKKTRCSTAMQHHRAGQQSQVPFKVHLQGGQAVVSSRCPRWGAARPHEVGTTNVSIRPSTSFLEPAVAHDPVEGSLDQFVGTQSPEIRVPNQSLRRCLEDCAVAIAKQPVSAAWQANAVHNQLRCAGPVSRLDLARLRDHVLLF